MINNKKITRVVPLLVSIATTTAYGSEKPSKRNYAPLQAVALESNTLSPRNTSAKGSPKSSISDRQATLTQELPLAANAGQTPRRSFSEWTQNSPKSSTSIELADQAATCPSSLSRQENKSSTVDYQETVFSNWKKAVLETRYSSPCCLKCSCGALCIAGVITIIAYGHEIEKVIWG